MIFPWVGFANKPLSRRAIQRSQAVLLSSVSLMITAFKSPLPLTSVTKSHVSANVVNSDLNNLPNSIALTAKFSSNTTCNAAFATAHASGLPPNVEPCSPGLIVSIISSSANTAETGRTPPLNALPRITISGRASYLFSHCAPQSQLPQEANKRPVLAIPV